MLFISAPVLNRKTKEVVEVAMDRSVYDHDHQRHYAFKISHARYRVSRRNPHLSPCPVPHRFMAKLSCQQNYGPPKWLTTVILGIALAVNITFILQDFELLSKLGSTAAGSELLAVTQVTL